MAGRAPVQPAKSKKPKALPLEEQVRRRAHEIYLERGGQDGAEIDDWLQAEREIMGETDAEAGLDRD